MTSVECIQQWSSFSSALTLCWTTAGSVAGWVNDQLMRWGEAPTCRGLTVSATFARSGAQAGGKAFTVTDNWQRPTAACRHWLIFRGSWINVMYFYHVLSIPLSWWIFCSKMSLAPTGTTLCCTRPRRSLEALHEHGGPHTLSRSPRLHLGFTVEINAIYGLFPGWPPWRPAGLWEVLGQIPKSLAEYFQDPYMSSHFQYHFSSAFFGLTSVSFGCHIFLLSSWTDFLIKEISCGVTWIRCYLFHKEHTDLRFLSGLFCRQTFYLFLRGQL